MARQWLYSTRVTFASFCSDCVKEDRAFRPYVDNVIGIPNINVVNPNIFPRP